MQKARKALLQRVLVLTPASIPLYLGLLPQGQQQQQLWSAKPSLHSQA